MKVNKKEILNILLIQKSPVIWIVEKAKSILLSIKKQNFIYDLKINCKFIFASKKTTKLICTYKQHLKLKKIDNTSWRFKTGK